MQAVASAEAALGGIDALVFFAGLMRTGMVEATDAETWDTIFSVDARGTFFASKNGTPALERAGGGCFITTSSLAGLRGAPQMTANAATKEAVCQKSTKC